MNYKAKVFIELYGPADSEGRKLIYLRVYWRAKTKRYSSGCHIRLSKEQFANTRLKITATALEEVEPSVQAARRIADELGLEFSFQEFERRYKKSRLGRQENDGVTLSDVAADYYESRPISDKTAKLYSAAVNWMTRYAGDIRLVDITVATLYGYIAFMKEQHRKDDAEQRKKRGELSARGNEISENTVRAHLRSLKALYNYGVKKTGLQKTNPFGELERQPLSPIPRQKGAILSKELQALADYVPVNKSEELSKDFFLLSLQLSGANFGDILSLRNGDIHGDEIWFTRRKTRRGGIITKIPYTSYTKRIFEKYGKLDPEAPDREILPVLWGAASEKLIDSRIHDFIAKVNKGLRSVADALGMESFTTMIARHSFAVLSESNGFTVEQIQHFMGHASPLTTRVYIKSIDTGVIRRSADMLEGFAPKK